MFDTKKGQNTFRAARSLSSDYSMAEPAAAGGDGKGDPFSIVEEALERGGYTPVPKADDKVNALGMDGEFDWFVYNILAAAGINVECQHERHEVEKYSAVQIVSRYDRVTALEVKNEGDIKLVEKEAMHGLQVKLNGAHTWKVEVTDEPLEQHGGGSARAASRARASTKVTTLKNMHQYEIAVPVPDGDVVCTAAVARNLTINLAFKTDQFEGADRSTEKSQWKDGLPLIAQRRIDAVFTNQFFTCAQVRVPCARTQNGTRNTNALSSTFFCGWSGYLVRRGLIFGRHEVLDALQFRVGKTRASRGRVEVGGTGRSPHRARRYVGASRSQRYGRGERAMAPWITFLECRRKVLG